MDNLLKHILETPIEDWSLFGAPIRSTRVLFHVTDTSSDPPLYRAVTAGEVRELIVELNDQIKELREYDG